MSGSGTVTSLRLSEEELVLYRAAAARAGLSVSAWTRRALKGTAELEAALAREEERRLRPVSARGGA